MAKIKQTCPCGAVMKFEGKDGYECGHRSREFLEAHAMCRDVRNFKKLTGKEKDDQRPTE